jgi:hypothetical protein
MKTSDAIKGIIEHRKNIHENNYWHDPEKLSDTMARLATYNAYLADDIARLHRQASESQLIAFREARKLEIGVTEAERLSRGESLDDREKFENISYIYKATNNLITVLQSRLKVIADQRRQEGISE